GGPRAPQRPGPLSRSCSRYRTAPWPARCSTRRPAVVAEQVEGPCRRPPGSSRGGRPGLAPGADAAPKGRLSPLRSPRGRPCAPPRRKNGHATAGGSGALADARAGGCEERPAALNGRRPGLSPPAPQVKTGVVLACEACVRQHTIFSIPQGLLRCLGNSGGVWL